MSRRKKHEEHDNHDRWLVSYADFITLLFAFFVVMYAISSVNEGKYRILSDTLATAFSGAARSDPVTVTQPQAQSQPAPRRPKVTEAQKRQRERMQNVAKDILQVLAPLVSGGQVRVTQSPRGVSIEINASVLFAPGQAVLQPESAKALRAVAEVLRGEAFNVEVEGHTDDTPIGTAAFPSNWELSAARAASVVRLFAETGVTEQRLAAIGYGEHRPLQSNDAPEGRARNRRVAVTILSPTEGPVTEVPVPDPAASRPENAKGPDTGPSVR